MSERPTCCFIDIDIRHFCIKRDGNTKRVKKERKRVSDDFSGDNRMRGSWMDRDIPGGHAMQYNVCQEKRERKK